MNLMIYKSSFIDLDQGSERIVFKSIFTTLEASSILWVNKLFYLLM